MSSPAFKPETIVLALSKAIPPPGTIPSFIAAFVAHMASSTLSLFSLSSTSELAPTFITPTFPASLDSLLSNWCFFPLIFVSLICFFIA